MSTILKYPNLVAELAVEKFLNEHVQDYKEKSTSCWRIKWRGEFMKLNSGKSSWATKGRAISAFKNHIRRTALHYWYERYLTGNDKLSYHHNTVKPEDFYKLIEPELEYVQS